MRDAIEQQGSGGDEPVRVEQGKVGSVHFRAVQFGMRRPGLGGLLLLLIALAALALGGVLLTLGVFLLAGLAIAGAVAGGGVLLYRRIRHALRGGRTATRHLELDPSKELAPAMEIRPPGEPSRE